MPLALDEAISNYTVTREKRASAYNMPATHYHDHYEIYFLTRGKVRYFIEDEVYDVEQGDIVLIPPRVIHKTATRENRGAERLLIAFTSKFLMRTPSDRLFECFKARIFKNAPVEHIMLKAEQEFKNNDYYSEEMIAGCIRELLVCCTRMYEKSKETSHMHESTFVQEAVRYISEFYADEITLSKLAEMFAVSESHFSRSFKAFTGLCLSEYINLVRIKNAETILRTEKLSVTEAAARCGFNSSSYFTAVFRKTLGITPKKLCMKTKTLRKGG